MTPCTCEFLMHHAGCEYDGPEITARESTTMAMSNDEIRAEWARLSEAFETRMDLHARTMERHKRERDLVWGDLAEAGAARDRFAREHPELLGGNASGSPGAGGGQR